MKKAWLAGAVVALAAGAASADPSGHASYLGTRADAVAFAREIVINAQTRWINVESGEIVKLVDASSGQSVVWRFDTLSWAVGKLGDIAPALAGGRNITLYIAESPQYMNDT